MSRPADKPPSQLLRIPPDDQLGEAMLACTPKQRAFVIALAQTGGRKSDAAVLAGSEDGNSAKCYAQSCMNNPKVRKALREWAEVIIQSHVFVGVQALVGIAQNDQHKDQLKAAVELMNRNGMVIAQKIEIEHRQDTRTLQVIVDEIRALAQGSGIDARLLLTSAGVPMEVIDADFQVVRTADAPSSAGLEDLI